MEIKDQEPLSTTGVRTLFHVPFYQSAIAVQLSIELQIPPSQLEIRTLTIEQVQTDPRFSALSPRRCVPILIEPDGTAVDELGAVLTLLLDLFDTSHTLRPIHPLAAPGSTSVTTGAGLYARSLRGLFFATATAFHKIDPVIQLSRVPESARDVERLGAAVEDYKRDVITPFESALVQGSTTYYNGDNFSAIDIVMCYNLMCWEYCKIGPHGSSVVDEYLERVKKRPSFQKAFFGE